MMNLMNALVAISAVLAAHGAAHAEQGALVDESSSSIHFVAIGDWGAPLTSSPQRSGQQAVADGVASWLEQRRLTDNSGEAGQVMSRLEHNENTFIISLGDNFYPVGVKDVHDMENRFDQSFDDIYHHSAFNNVPWYAIAGNKDYGAKPHHVEGYVNEADVTAQMNFSGSSRWNFPDYFHRVVREVQDSFKVEIILIDTMQLAGSIHYPHKGSSRSRHTSQHIADRGFQWINHLLKHSDADYLLVAGHFPAKSVDGLEEMMEVYKVSAYIGGHVHCQKHERRSGIDYFISGAGMEIDCGGDAIDHNDATGGFMTFHAGVNKMVVKFHDQAGNELHRTEISPRSGKELSDVLSDESEVA